jgi:predicted transcriptional regulator
MRVLLSIKPEFARRIFNGTKRYEYRKAIFTNDEVNKIVVYASDPIKKVIGEFEVGGILHDDPRELWAKTRKHSGINKKRFLEYFANRNKGYAIEIVSTRLYDAPLPLDSLMVTSPPQSFVYLW